MPAAEARVGVHCRPAMTSLVRIVTIGMACLAGASAGAVARPDADACIAKLRAAVVSKRDGSHLPLVFGLRQLRDPDLRPLFERLVRHDDWQLQTHAVLALAEIDAAGGGSPDVDPALIAAVSPLAQEAIIVNAIDLGSISRGTMEALFVLDELPPMSRIMLAAELSLQDEHRLAPDEPRRAIITMISAHEDPTIAGLAALLLAEYGDAQAFTAFRSRIAALDAAPRRRLILWLFDAIRQYRLAAAMPWIRELLHSRGAELDEDVQHGAVLTLLWLDPSASGPGMSAWRAFLAESPSYRRRVQCGLMLLASAESLPAGAFEELAAAAEPDEELVAAMAAAGRAVAAGPEVDASQPIIALLELGHGRTTEWALTMLEKLPPPQARAVALHIIDSVDKPKSLLGGSPSGRAAMAVKATATLIAIDPEALARSIMASSADGLARQTMLLGLFESDSPRAGELAAQLPRIGAGRADSMALLLVARHERPLSDEDVRRLALIAAGGGRVSDVLQAQAAWLHLKHTGRAGAALAGVLE
jgi:hypothetical protein